MTSAAEDLALDFLSDEDVEEPDREQQSQDEEADHDGEAKAPHEAPHELVDADLEAVLHEIAQHDALKDDDDEFKLLAKANDFSTVVDGEISTVHTTIRNYYSIRFPELETMVQNPLQYAKAVYAIGNGPMDKIKELVPLKSVMNGSLLMGVALTGTQTTGREMNVAELQRVMDACERSFSLDRAKRILTEYVQTCMDRFAPNLTALIGSLTAAQLINAAGGLKGLAKAPACNLPALGVTKSLQAGMATNVAQRQQGFLYDSEVVKDVPSDLKRQALRIVSAKVVLAARIDSVRSSRDGQDGEQLRDDCERRIDKLKEPPPNNGPKALPAPDDKPSRKRGGRRARKAKEATAVTDLRKAQNRMAFGKEEAEVGYGTGDGTAGLGMIGQANEGHIRSLQIDQRTKAKLSKNHKGWGASTSLGGAASSLRGFGQGAGAGNASVLRAHGLRSSGVGTSGTASSIAFTPVQGLELVDPKAQLELKRKRAAEDDRWFKSGTFTQVGGSSSIAGTGTRMDGVFKVPQLPAGAKENGTMGPPPPKKQEV